MSAVGRDARRLLRWYPRAWRERHGAVLLGTLEDRAGAEGGATLSRADAWSMRVHGLAERLSPRTGAVLALAGVLALVLGYVGVLTVHQGGAAASTATSLLLAGVGPLLLALSALTLVRDLGLTAAAGTVLTATAAVVASVLAVLAASSFSLGFDELDEGRALSPFAAASPFLLVAMLVVVAVALTPVLSGALRGVKDARLRRTMVVLLAVPGSVGVPIVLAPGTALLVGVALLVACWVRAHADRGGRHPTVGAAPTVRAAGDVPRAVAPDPTRHRRTVLVLAGTSGVLTLACAAYLLPAVAAVVGRSWVPGALGELPAENVGLAAGALASVPSVAALGLVAARRWGRTAHTAAALLGFAAVLRAVSAAMGPEGEAGTYVLFAGGLVVGLALVLPFTRRVPGSAVARSGIAVVVAVGAGAVVGIPALAVLPVVAPLLAAGLVVVALRSGRSRPAGSPPSAAAASYATP